MAVTVAFLLPTGWMWQQSLVPSTYSVTDVGYADYGGSSPATGHDKPARRSVRDLVTRSARRPDVKVELVARRGKVTLASGRVVDGYSLNGTTPGPQITATQGQLIEVRVRNASVDGGIAFHWHGLDVPNAEDGVPGVTQDTVGVGQSRTYRFIARKAGTYWYHSHQAVDQVSGGLLGSLVVLPRGGIEQDKDILGVVHAYQGVRTLNGRDGTTRVTARPGNRVRIRVVNSDNVTVPVWASVPYRVLAIDADDLGGPTPVADRYLSLAAGGRADLEITIPRSGAARVHLGSTTALVVGAAGVVAPDRPTAGNELNLLNYGASETVPFDLATPNRKFTYVIGKRFGFFDGQPGRWWTINGRGHPNLPRFTVSNGDLVTFRVINRTSDVQAISLHGHRVVITARNGKPLRGSPVWYDSFEVRPGETVDIAFRTTNPGIWAAHGDLPDAADGLVAQLVYEGVTTPYKVNDVADDVPR